MEQTGALDPFGLVAGLLAALCLAAVARVLAPGRRVGLGASVGALASATASLLVALGGDQQRLVLAAFAAGAAGAIVGGCAGARLDRRVAVIVAASLPAVVIGPLTALQLAFVPPALELAVGALDIGGTIGRVAVPAAVVLGLMFALPAGRSRERAASRPPAVGAAILGAVAVAAGALAAEGSAGDTTPSILGHLAIGAILGAVAWMLVVRIAARPAVVLDPAGGALAGAGAVALGAALLLPVTAAAVAAIAGFVGGVFRTRGNPVRGAAAGVLAALATGGIVVGLLADGVGLAATGSLTQAGAQLLGIAVIAAVGSAAGLIAGALGRLIERRTGPRNDDSPGEPGL